MQTGGDKNLERVREEHTKRIFELYQSRAKNFRNTIIALFFFGFFFLSFILIPHVSIEVREGNTKARLDELSSQFDDCKRRLHIKQTFGIKPLEWMEKPVYDCFNDRIDELKKNIGDLGKEIEELNGRLDKLKTEKEQVAERLNQIEFPFGKFSVGLNESIVMFPILLAIGFSISVLLFSETIRLRRAFHTLSQQEDSGRALLTDEQIALVAPLWYDPVNSVWNQIIQAAILLMPFVFFVLACGLIHYSWIRPDPFITVAQLDRRVYYGMYLLSFGVFAYSYWRIIIQLLHYSGKRDENGNEME